MRLELDKRKVLILKSIIKNYMETGEPVGSRTISKLPGLNLSSATIRNEMSDLEDMGYILQPHTSAGRVPSDKGYRFYVDEILKDKEIGVAEFKTDVLEKVGRLEVVLRKLAKIIASNTNYATMISGPKVEENKIKFLQLSKLEGSRILIVTVFDGNIVKNNIMDLKRELSADELLDLNLLLNTSLNGLSIDEITLAMMAKLKSDAGVYGDVMDMVLSEIARAFTSDDEDLQIYTSGATNIFKYPELSDGEKASKLIDAFEQKEKLKRIFDQTQIAGNDYGIQVYIGEELPVQNMQDCSLVTAKYEFGHGICGTIGIVGPKRMDYERVVQTIKEVMAQMDQDFKDK